MTPTERAAVLNCARQLVVLYDSTGDDELDGIASKLVGLAGGEPELSRAPVSYVQALAQVQAELERLQAGELSDRSIARMKDGELPSAAAAYAIRCAGISGVADARSVITDAARFFWPFAWAMYEDGPKHELALRGAAFLVAEARRLGSGN